MNSSGWGKTTLGKVSRIICGATPSTNVPEYWLDEIKWVAAKDVSESTGYKIYDTERKISRLGFENCSTKMIPSESTVLIARGATMGRSCMLGEDMAINQTCYALIPNRDEINPHFLFYSIKFLYNFFQQIAHGAIFNTVIGSGLRNTEIYLPSLPEQRAIAHILGTLDDKIELNRKMNVILEALARAFFKSWFVDFDPVYAKANGESPVGMDTATAALFPDDFEESALGLIPKGWRVGTISDSADIISGKRPDERSTMETEELAIPLYGGGGQMGYVKCSLYNQPIILTGRVGTLGKVFRITSPCWPSDNTLTVLPYSETAYELVYFQLNQVDFPSLNRGSTQPLITQGDLKKWPIVVPTDDCILAFHNLVNLLFARIDANERESRTLIVLRDTLLPKLISGEVRVPEVETFIGG